MNLRRKFDDCGHRVQSRRLFCTATAALSLMCISAVPGFADNDSQGSAAGPDQIHQQIQEVESDPEIQKEIQKQIEAVESDPDIQKDRPDPKPPKPRESYRIHFPPWLPYVILGAAGLGLLFLITRLALQYRRPQTDIKAEAPLAASPGTALASGPKEHDPSFDEIDALANAGAFAEAVHRLLLLVQSRLRPRLESGMQPSLTSREILRRAKLTGEATTAFGRLVGAVELTLFGMQKANAAIYASCREDCRVVLEAAA